MKVLHIARVTAPFLGDPANQVPNPRPNVVSIFTIDKGAMVPLDLSTLEPARLIRQGDTLVTDPDAEVVRSFETPLDMEVWILTAKADLQEKGYDVME